MNKNNFTEEEIIELNKNKYIKNVTFNSISFTKEFKEHFIKESNNGKGPTRIFVESNLNPYIIGGERIKGFSRIIKIKIKILNLLMINVERKVQEELKKNSNVYNSKDEEIDALKHENLLLKAENDLLKKMEFLIKQKELKNCHQAKDSK